ncbi:hypothetical protein BKA70DRAFT_1471156 [Coprinopsis sp. MPI-PUGE-AT-0042]|nr:hypothetical protein BKA70DRAFT_1471156 [Coprinopsis sp. MPI-PUGE-AT-0042]
MELFFDLHAIITAPPPQLTPFLKSNALLPSHLLPCLSRFLQTIAWFLERLQAEIRPRDSEQFLEFEKQAYKRARKVYEAYGKITAPIRRVPIELLVIIFHFAVDTPPFNRYIDVAQLRSVCSLWRGVAMATPGLWTSLHIDLDTWCLGYHSRHIPKGALLLQFKRALAPWTAILSRSIPYHLRLSSSTPPTYYRRQNGHTNLLHLLLSDSEPPYPGIVTFNSLEALDGATRIRSAAPSVLTVQIETARLNEIPRLEPVFPNLRILVVNSLFDCGRGRFSHSSLQSLHTTNLNATPRSFAHFLRLLPSLCEFKLKRAVTVTPDFSIHPPTVDTHSSLKVLIAEGEQTLLLFSHVALPSLRLLAVKGFRMHTPSLLYNEILPQIVAGSSLNGFTLSLSGKLYRPFLQRGYDVAPRVPIESDNLKAIFCNTNAGSLTWLGPGPARRSSSRSLTVHIPKGSANEMAVEWRREELEGAGYCLVLCSPDEIEGILYSVAPELRGVEWNS